MKGLEKRILWILVISAFLGCSQPEAEPVNDNGPDPGYTQYGTPFENVPITEDIVMYEVNLRAFSESGDLQGVMDRLGELRALGVNVIWLMPIHPIGEINSVNSPYSVRDYYEVSHEYGDLEGLRMLTDQAHAMDMAVIMDWVANHTAWDNPWIANTDWYTQDADGNIVHPPGTNWYDVADLNFDNNLMREAMIDAMTYWVLEANIDGYRCDYADGVPFDFWQQAIDSLRSIPGRDLILLAEGGRVDHLVAGFDMNWSWDFYFRMIDVYNGQPATILYTTHVNEYAGVPEGKHRLRYTTNHDESAWNQTPMVLFNGKQGALAASVVTTFMGGVPLLYTGQEVGRVENVAFFSQDPINWQKNPDMLQAYQDIMNAYNAHDAARKGSISNFSTQDIVCFTRSLPGEDLLILVNMRDQGRIFSVPPALQNTEWTNPISGSSFSLETSIQLENYQYLILKKAS